MDINQLLKGIDCACGKHHSCPIEKVYVEKNATARLKEVTSNYQKILLVADQNTYKANGEKVVSVLKDKEIKKIIFSGEKVVIPNEEAIERVLSLLDGIELIIAIGSGVMQDLCKYVSFKSGISYMVVATAPSMDGYASDGAAMILGGMKVTVKAGLPKAIIADTLVLKDAPMEMIKAGYGDVLGKYSALNDWKLSKVVNDEYFCQFIYDITYQKILNLRSTAKGLLRREEKSIKYLMEALVTVGIMMSFAGTSRPASGSEHHLSHFFEIVGIINDEKYFAHGIDVVYSTVITAKLREELLKYSFPKTNFKIKREEYISKMQEVYKSVGESVVALQDKVGNYKKDRSRIYLEKEKEIKDILRECPTSKEIEEMLLEVEMNISDFYSLYGKEKIDLAIKYAKDLKDRYTVLWLNYDLKGEVNV